MISNRTIIEFGSGSNHIRSGINENGEGMILMRSIVPGPIGRRVDGEVAELTLKDPEAVLLFTNVEGLEVFLRNIIGVKEMMIEENNDKNEKETDQCDI